MMAATSDGWQASAAAWIAHIGETGDRGRADILDRPMMDAVTSSGAKSVLDVGCGPGRYYDYISEHLPGVEYVGLDYAYPMLEGHNGEGVLSRGAMEQLPFADHSFDIVMANHVLYLAPDVESTVRELRRVLKPGGVLMATTTSTTSTPQFRELFRRAILLVSPPGRTRDIKIPETLHGRFALENGSRILSRHFYAVVRHDLPAALVFNEVDPIIDYLEATRPIREPQLPEGVSWDQVMMIMREQITNLIMSLNALVVDKLTGVLMASDNGGFINEFTEIQAKLDAEG
ncbi:MAG: methyltransferase domain-containing protein [Chloroflexota bacterium]